MKTLLIGINSKFIHTNLAIYSIKEYCNEYKDIFIKEYTINNNTYDIMTEIYEEFADVVAFSCYIWNIEVILDIARELKKVSPSTKILLGGPEVSYGTKYLKENSFIDFIIQGEGEEAFKSFMKYINYDIKKIYNLLYRDEDNIIQNKKCDLVDINKISFIYENLNIDLSNRIIYYEASRGCPYSCQFCLSSSIEGVRVLNIDRIKSDLRYFLNNKVPQVKFVDRTFNFNKKNTIDIWEFIINNDNGFTNFHFELSADLLNDDSIELLKKARIGLFQFEIGVQSTNIETLKSTRRVNKNEKIFKNVAKEIELKNIHQHLDLIVGLPYEDYNIFKNSFNEVYALNPEKLQVGFLKLLYGTKIIRKATDYEMVFTKKAPYEILKTKWLTFDDIIILKGIDEMVDNFYNSGKFKSLFKYLTKCYSTPFNFYEKLFKFYKNQNLHMMLHKKITIYNFMYEFIKSIPDVNVELAVDLLKFDLYVNENIKSIPYWIDEHYRLNIKNKVSKYYNDVNFVKDNFNNFIDNNNFIIKKQILKMTKLDYFNHNIIKYIECDLVDNSSTLICFDYSNRDLYNEIMGYGHCTYFRVVE